ncbi:hypothetical protein TREPR_3647 [Treponema primitia ZAS-2]|uniref:Uncharacterized protein n=1 Tax=Treponema primitia (strain ATCC BAA-887 / DSM 12427 / ZAS-2) TaxID=545694 RepID=F5YQY0_TREPZ|nr:hypothetical protein [Treponema primitia]AEF85811.1 hypothetical protein TREPR_3647 [Treponema primitia ZAS-2]
MSIFENIFDLLPKYLYSFLISISGLLSGINPILIFIILLAGLIFKKIRPIVIIIIIFFSIWWVYNNTKPEPTTIPETVPAETYRPIPKKSPNELKNIQSELNALMNLTSEYFSTMAVKPDVAIYPFTISGGTNPPILLLLADDFAYFYSKDKNVKLAKRWFIEPSESDDGSIANAGKRQGANYVIAGKVIPIGEQVRVSVLIISIETSEITETYMQTIIKSEVEDLLIEKQKEESHE